MTRNHHESKPASQRQLKVGEMIRHALASIFIEGKLAPELDNIPITVSEVKISPDLRNATAYVTPFNLNTDATVTAKTLEQLNAIAPQLRNMVTARVKLKYSPNITFRSDSTFETADRIDTLLKSVPAVTQDSVLETEEA